MASPEEKAVMAASNSSINGTDTSSSTSNVNVFLDYAGIFLVQSQLIVNALGIIYLGAHASLRRPPSAAPPKAKSNGKRRKKEPKQFTEGLQASDAIMFPILAGAVLIGLYYLIKWLQDPALLNKILRGYMSAASIMSFGKLAADSLHCLTSLVFPSTWKDGKGRVFRIDPIKRCQWEVGSKGDEQTRTRDEQKTTPFPGLLSKLARSPKQEQQWWTIRRLLKEEWTVKLALHGMGSEKFGITLNGLFGTLLGASLAILYYSTANLTLNNIMGLGLCYGAFIVLSCTSFAIGSMVLMGLFFYDIVMVFYTPFMITVATKIDAPVKLVFHGMGQASLLGLGDIVIPGIFICLSLRFDLWRYYQQQIKYVDTELTSETPTESATSETRQQAVKADFVSPQGRWGDRFWMFSRGQTLPTTMTPGLKAASFPKPYFYTSLFGYTAGMLLTLCMLLVFKHGQPALLYLVPGVVISTWLRGYFTGQLHDMWTYTEDGTIDTKDVVVEIDSEGRVVKEISVEKDKKSDQKVDKQDGLDGKPSASATPKSSDPASTTNGQTGVSGDRGHDVFLLSIHAPGDSEIDEDED